MKLAIVGAGAMGSALLAGWLAAGWRAEDIVVVERCEVKQTRLLQEYGVRCVPLNEVGTAQTIVLAVKPQQLNDLLAQLEPDPAALVVSVAAGVSLAVLEEALGSRAVIRVMPNTGALVGRAMSGIIPGRNATAEQLERVKQLFDLVGRTMITDEAHLDALTAISGSGPAYLFYVADALIEAGVHQGLTRAAARELTVQTFVGAAELLADSGRSAVELREQVTSPAGTTAAALRVLDNHAVRAAFLAAVQACAARSAELARNDG